MRFEYIGISVFCKKEQSVSSYLVKRDFVVKNGADERNVT